MSASTLERLAGSCAEFLVHGVDVEGKQLGIDAKLVSLLGASSPVPATYAGGVSSMVRHSWCQDVHSNPKCSSYNEGI